MDSKEDNPRFRATKPDRLLRSQEPAIRVIVNGVIRTASEVIGSKTFDAKARRIQLDDFSVERPHHVYLIDGGRGAGKTYTLLSAEYALRQLGQLLLGQGDPAWRDLLIGGGDKDVSNALEKKLKTASSSGGRLTLVETMKIIFPGDLMMGESLMEAIFASMSRKLHDTIDDLKDSIERDRVSPSFSSRHERSRLDDGRGIELQNLQSLAATLRTEVEQGWYFANRFGLDALVRDSADYTDLVTRWAEESGKSSHRIDNWRTFVSDYLDARNTALLVILVDDSDVRQELTADLLHSIRMFLNHPRIVTVLAGNLKAMRDTLLHQSMQRIAPAIKAFAKQDHPFTQEWQRHERQTIEEYLEKVLPPAQRIYLSPPRGSQTAHPATKDKTAQAGQGGGDFGKIAGVDLWTFLNNAISAGRDQFLKVKFKLALERALNRIDAPSDAERSALETYLSWWLFANMYADLIAPQSARQITTFGNYYKQWFGADWSKKTQEQVRDDLSSRPLSPKRLPVMLFETPSNFTLIHRLTDEDINLPDWIRRQKLTSHWVGRRHFSISGEEVHDGSFSYRYLRYRLDVGLSMPVRDNSDDMLPDELLPKPLGRKHMRRFFQPRQSPRRNRRIGVSRWIEHAAIPGNCIYFHDLQALPDVSFMSAAELARAEEWQSGEWEAQLADRWQELIEDRHDRREDEYLIRYFYEIVCESLRFTGHITSAALIPDFDPPDIIEKQTFAIYEHFLADELGIFAANTLERRREWLQAFSIDPNDPRNAGRSAELTNVLARLAHNEILALKGDPTAQPTPAQEVSQNGLQWPPNRPRRMIALYSALVNDLRRAWHAIRIYESSPVYMGGARQDPTREQPLRTSLAAIANRDRMQLYRREDIEAILNRSDWVRRTLKVFRFENINPVLQQALDEQEYSSDDKQKISLSEKSINSIYLAKSPDIVEQEQLVGEREDFNRWTKTLRSIGRAMCKDWPVFDVLVNNGRLDVEDLVFKNGDPEAEEASSQGDPNYVMLRIFKTVGNDHETEKLQADLDLRRKNSRSARNLVLLLYGLAPSLSAVIHTHVMSYVYQAELLASAYEATTKQKGPLKPKPSPAPNRRVYDPKKFYEDSQKLYVEAFDEIRAWGQLLGSLSVLLRYIKIKCLHLDTALLLDPLKLGQESPQAASLAAELMALCSYRVTSPAPPSTSLVKHKEDIASQFVELLRSGRIVSPPAGGSGGPAEQSWQGFKCERIAEGLAIFPDVAPSTLFGDLWIQDILGRLGVANQVIAHFGELVVTDENKRDKENEEDPLSVNGIFGETEQWLWSANRTLRKLQAVLSARHEKLSPAKAASAAPELTTAPQKPKKSHSKPNKPGSK